MVETFNSRFKIILGHERATAKAVAVAFIKPKPVSVWEITIPVIFVLNFVKMKHSREIFVQNHLYTKELALKAALETVDKSSSKETVMAGIDSQTKEILASVPDGIYSDDIRCEQLKEIDLLIDHYCKLLAAEGGDYPALIVSAYKSREEVALFLSRLKSIENDVVAAARRTLGDKMDAGASDRLVEITDYKRAAEVETIFNPDPQQQDAQ